MYRIGEFSKIAKLTVKTLRFYEESGLLLPNYIDKFTGYRYYEINQLYTTQQIIAFKEAGFSIDEISQILSGKDVSELVDEKEFQIQKQLKDSEEKLKRLKFIKKYYSEEQKMNYQAIIKQLPSYTVYYKQFKVKDFSQYGEIIPEIGATISKVNPDLKCVDPSYCYVEYIDGEYKSSDFNVEYAEAVEKVGKEVDGIKFKVLPACEIACVMHKGKYDGLRNAYTYLLNWIKDNGYEIVGNGREQYIDGCWNKENENDYLTEVQFVIRKA